MITKDDYEKISIIKYSNYTFNIISYITMLLWCKYD